MSRNMIKANKYIFSEFINFVNESGIHPIKIDQNKNRYINTKDFEKEWLKKLEIKRKQLILQNFTTAYIYFEQQSYFVVIGWFEAVKFNEVISDFPLNAGVITALLFELKLSVRQNSNVLEIIDEILFQDEDPEDPGCDYEVVMKYFEKIRIYQILKESPFQKEEQLEKISGFYIIKNNHNLFLKFSNETLNIFEKIFLEGSDYIPYENLLLSLNSTSWKYSFLDIYRCIEQMFPLAKLDELCKNTSISIPLIHFSNEIERILGWKPREEDSLGNIIDNSSAEAKQLFSEVKIYLGGTKDEKIEKFVYKIRNSIVHHRLVSQDTDLSKLDNLHWDKLIRGALLVVIDLYAQYNLHLSEKL